jgi:hypothetical protein
MAPPITRSCQYRHDDRANSSTYNAIVACLLRQSVCISLARICSMALGITIKLAVGKAPMKRTSHNSFDNHVSWGDFSRCLRSASILPYYQTTNFTYKSFLSSSRFPSWVHNRVTLRNQHQGSLHIQHQGTLHIQHQGTLHTQH